MGPYHSAAHTQFEVLVLVLLSSSIKQVPPFSQSSELQFFSLKLKPSMKRIKKMNKLK